MKGMLSAEAFYRRLVALDTIIEPGPLVAEAVRLITGLTGAHVGYVELFPIEPSGEPPFRTAHCAEGATEVERCVSQDIIRAVVKDRATLNLASAAQHPRFRASKNVVDNQIHAVLCSPIGVGAPVGVVYVQGRKHPGRFLDVDRERAEHFAERLAIIADRIRFGRDRARITLDDEIRWLETRAVRVALDRHNGNRSSAARELGVTRARLYRILNRGA